MDIWNKLWRAGQSGRRRKDSVWIQTGSPGHLRRGLVGIACGV